LKYCTYCGKHLKDGEVCACEGARASERDKTQKAITSHKKLLVPVMVVMATLIVLVVLISGGKNTLHLEDYIIIEGVTGTEGHGVLEYSLDEYALTNDMFGDLYEKDVSDDDWEATLVENFERQVQVDNALDCIILTADPEVGLATGDKVTVTATFKNTEGYKFDFKFKNGSKTYIVDSIVPETTIDIAPTPAPSDSNQEGQETVQLATIDPFAEENISVTFTGVNGSGNVVIEVLSEEDVIRCFNYWSPDVNNLLGTGNLSNGDIITVKADYLGSDLNALGYEAPEFAEKTYTVTGLSEYYDLSAGLPDDMMNEFYEFALGLVKEDDTAINAEAATDPVIEKIYHMTSVDPTWPHFSNAYSCYVQNGVAVVIRSTVDAQRWHFIVAPNFIVDSEGQIQYEMGNILTWTLTYDSLDDLIGWAEGIFYDMEIVEAGTL